MNFELDHVFLYCNADAPEAAALIAQGLTEGSPNVHPGQGTANRRFFFANAYLELLWVSNPEEAQKDDVAGTQIWDRWQQRNSGACPIGFAFRPRGDAPEPAPFQAWLYKPSYLSGGLSIDVGMGVLLSEPQLFYLPFGKRRPSVSPQPRVHPAGIHEIAGVCVSLPNSAELSPSVQAVVAGGLISVRTAPEYHLELTFLGDRAAPLDLRPALPLTFVPQVTDTR